MAESMIERVALAMMAVGSGIRTRRNKSIGLYEVIDVDVEPIIVHSRWAAISDADRQAVYVGYTQKARAAIEAMREPTPRMIEAGVMAEVPALRDDFEPGEILEQARGAVLAEYAAMIAEALKDTTDE